MESKTYTILEEKREEVEKKLRRLSKKAQKYDIPFSAEYGEPYAIEIEREIEGQKLVEKYEVFDLTIESETIKKDGYTIVAHIEHSEHGNIVNVFEGEIDKRWIKFEPYCEHCNSNHGLKYTFMVSNGKETKQVGRTCLKDYCGIDPQVVGMINQFTDEIDEYTAEGYDFGVSIPCVFDTTDVLALAIDIAKEQGYIRSDERGSNKGELLRLIGKETPSAEAYKEAHEMSKEIAEMSIDDAIDARLNNVQVRVNCKYCKPSDFGYIAYAPIAFERYMKRIESKKRRVEEANALSEKSEYVGTVGERTVFDIAETKLLTSFYNEYGTTFLYRFIDTNGNVLIWFASSQIKEGEHSRIKATVKAHSERDGIKQTILTRVKVA